MLTEEQQQELIAFLQEHLEIHLETGYDGCDSHEIEARVFLCGEQISYAQAYLD